MNASASNKNDAILTASIPLETEKSGSMDVECQMVDRQATTPLDSNSSTASANSKDRLVPGATTTFIEHEPPTLNETASIVGCCIVVISLTVVALFYATPHDRPIPAQYLAGSDEYIQNGTNNEVYKGETIDTMALFLLCVFVPGCIQAAYGCARGRPGDFYRTICTYFVAGTICGVVTEFLKNYVGYLRPIFFDQCNPDDTYETCQGHYSESDHVEVKELHKSFVSGHASFAFLGGVLFSLFLERTIGLSSVQVAVTLPQQQQSTIAYRKPPAWRRAGSILALSPMIVSVWAAASRIVDNVHFPADVVGGAILGGSIAAYCHPIWYTDPRYLPPP